MRDNKARQHAWLRAARMVLALGLVFGWEAGVRSGVIDAFYTSAPSEILATAIRWIRTGYILGHAAATLQVTLVGLAAGVALGVGAGGAVAFSRWLERICLPFLAVGNAVPRLILYPLIVLWLGFGAASRIALVVTLVFFTVVFNTHAAIRSVDSEIVRHARVLGARGWQLLRHVYLPAVAVWLLSTIRVTMGFALAGAIVGEYIGATRGVGMVVAFAQSMFNARDVMAGLVVLLVMIWGIDLGLRVVERAAGKWRAVEVS